MFQDGRDQLVIRAVSDTGVADRIESIDGCIVINRHHLGGREHDYDPARRWGN